MRRLFLLSITLAGLLLLGCLLGCHHAEGTPSPSEAPSRDSLAVATFAGGCFWCMEPPFDQLDGVFSTTSGYSGGHAPNPTYDQVSAGGTGHAEVVRVLYDPKKVSYEMLLDVFWRNIDPTDPSGQFCDKGDQYRSGIFVHDEEQKRLALGSKKKLESSGRFPRIVTEIVDASEFYPAEEYHQDYYEKNPVRYKFYRTGCGRDRRLQQLWGSAAGD